MKTINILLLSLLLSSTAFSQKLQKTYWDYRKTKIQSEYYTDAYGSKTGSYKGYSEYGGILLQGSYKDDAPIGKWTENYLNGKLHFIKIYTSPGYTNFDVNDGKIICYYEDGKTIKHERNFKNHELDGEVREYSENGILIKEGKYTNGVFERTGESKRMYDEEQEKLKLKQKEQEQKQKEQEEATAKKNAEEYQNIIPEADKALLAKDYKIAMQLYRSASDLMSNEKYPKDKISEIEEIYEANRKFFQEYLNAQYDSLEKDKKIFSEKIPLKTFDLPPNGMVATDSKGVTYIVAKYIGNNNYGPIECTKPWENRNWEEAQNCFRGNLRGLYSPTQFIITEEFFKFKKILETEERNIKNSSYDSKLFLENISTAKNNYHLSNLLIELQSKNIQIENLNKQNKKKTLFNKTQLVLKDFNILLQEKSELLPNIDNLIKINSFLDKVIVFYSQDTKDLESKLKVADTSEQIKTIILTNN